MNPVDRQRPRTTDRLPGGGTATETAFGRRFARGLRLLILLCPWLLGCLGGTQNPSYFPYLLPAGDIIRTHAKPPGFGYFANFDPYAHRLVLRPGDGACPIGTEKVFIATVYDAEGHPLRKRRVEWLLEGSGNLIEVDESGYFAGRGYKVDNHYAVSYTDYFEHTITRGTPDPRDDFVIRPGQTWCVVRSAVEGETVLTAYVPAISDWSRNKVVVRNLWVNAACAFPEAAVLPAGTAHLLTSKVMRHHDRQPLAGYQIRYRILEGPPVRLMPEGATALRADGQTDLTLASDRDGQASVRVVPLQPVPGQTRIRIETVRPADPSRPGSVDTVVGSSESTIEWQSAQVVLSLSTPPQARRRQAFPITLSVRNEGQVTSEPVALLLSVPSSFVLTEANPETPATGEQLRWQIPALPPEHQQLIQTQFQTPSPGKYTILAAIHQQNQPPVQESAITEITSAQLQIQATAPRVAVVGEQVPVAVQITNFGTAPVESVRLIGQYDAGLLHADQRNPLELTVDRIDPGQSRSVEFVLTTRQAGRWYVQVRVADEQAIAAQAEPLAIDVQDAQLMLSAEGPPDVFLNQAGTWRFRIRNAGKVPLVRTLLDATLPPELGSPQVSPPGQVVRRQVQWGLERLNPGEEKVVELTATAIRLGSGSQLAVEVTADPDLAVPDGRTATTHSALRQTTTVPVQILGVPALTVQVHDDPDPVAVGERVRYTVVVRNVGTLAASGNVIRCVLPAQLRINRARGPLQPTFTDQEVIFRHSDRLEPGDERSYIIEAEAQTPGDARFQVEVTSEALINPLQVEEATRVLSGG